MKKIILFSIAVLYVMGNADAWNVAAEPRLTENAYREVVKEAIAPMTQQQEDAFEYLVVWHKDRTIVTFHLAEKPKITYSGEKAIIQASTVIEYDFQEIRKMSFEKEIPIPTGISEKSIQRERPFKFGGETITFTCGDKDLNVKILSTNGMMIKQFVVRKGEEKTVSLNAFSTKIYMINVNGVTYKIHVR